MTPRQYILPVVLSFVVGGLSGAGASHVVTEHRLTVGETNDVHILRMIEELQQDVKWIKSYLIRENHGE